MVIREQWGTVMGASRSAGARRCKDCNKSFEGSLSTFETAFWSAMAFLQGRKVEAGWPACFTMSNAFFCINFFWM